MFNPIDDLYGNFGKIKSRELAAEVKTATDLIYAMIPVGSIHPILVHVPGCPLPDPNIWQECNGSEITNPNSPLRSQPGQPRYTPDMRERYLRITQSLGQVGFTGGVNSYSGFGHSHGIGSWSSPENADSSKSGTQNTMLDHSHGMSSDLNGTYDFEPEFYVLKFYMRIQ